MATKRMDNISLTENFEGSYPHLAWTMSEEEAFNLIPALEWPRPSLLTRFNREVRSIIDRVVACAENNPYHFHFHP